MITNNNNFDGTQPHTRHELFHQIFDEAEAERIREDITYQAQLNNFHPA